MILAVFQSLFSLYDVVLLEVLQRGLIARAVSTYCVEDVTLYGNF